MMMTPRSFLYSRKPNSPSPSPSSSPKTRKPAATPLLVRKDDRPASAANIASPTPPVAAFAGQPSYTMPKRKDSGSLSPPSRSPPSTTVTNAVARPITPTSAVQIPVKSKLDSAYTHKTRHQHQHAHHYHHHNHHAHADAHRRPSDPSPRRRSAHTPDVIPPSVAALLAVTAIPPPNRRASLRQRQLRESRMTVDSIVPRSQVSEKELSDELRSELSFSSSFSRSPMDVLLSPPEDLLDDEDASIISDSAFASVLSTRADSFDSLPSLGDSLGSSALPSVDGPFTPRGRMSRSPRRSLEPVSSPPGQRSEDPLSLVTDLEPDQVEFKVFDPSPTPAETQSMTVFLPLKTAFKSNLTASLRALRSAARSLSTFTASSVPADDLLTRSILTIDPRVPFTDERRPPVLEEEPTEAMRRYLNPTSNARLDLRTGVTPAARSFTASIQMQTYKIQRSRSAPPSANRASIAQASGSPRVPAPFAPSPGPRQREIRENSDFIRIAVMEHLMRKNGKLDSSQEGHARWLLPARKTSSKPYVIGSDGVPVRWVSQNLD